MKVFVSYCPERVARYIKTFFKGRIYIKGYGAFEFNYGRLTTLNRQTNRHFQTVADVNRHVDAFNTDKVA